MSIQVCIIVDNIFLYWVAYKSVNILSSREMSAIRVPIKNTERAN